MFGFGIQEIVLFVIITIVLSYTGLWPTVMRAFREFRGDRIEEPWPGQQPPGPHDIDLSYRLMGVSSTASWDEIERAYKKKAKIHHPDLGGDEDTMRALNEAYAVLKRIRKAR